MTVTNIKANATIKEIRKAMRTMDDGCMETLLIEGWGQIKKIGKRYCRGPLPELDDSDPMTDYTAWSFGWSEKYLLEDIARVLEIA